MSNSWIIRLRKPAQTDVLIGTVLLVPFVIGALSELLGLPWAIRYLADVAWCLLGGYLLIAKRRGVQMQELWVLAFLGYVLLSYLPQWQSPLYFLWGVRNNFRFYVAFFAFTTFLDREKAEKIFRLFDALFWLDVAAAGVQFCLLGLKGDHLGGLFGTQTGSNGYTNIFFLVIVVKSVVFCLDRREKIALCLAKCAAALAVAALAELKFFFVEFVLVIALAVLMTGFSWRKVLLLIAAAAGVMAGVALLTELFPGFDGWFSWAWFREMATTDRGYTSSGDLNRLNAVEQINRLWLKSGWKKCFGLGLGNCDTSSYPLLQTPFYEANGEMHYLWISYAALYLETGWIGLLFFFGFFVLVFFGIGKCEKRPDDVSCSYRKVGQMMALLCPVLAVYNSSLRAEAGYLAYFALAVPFAIARTADEQLVKRRRVNR